MTGVQTCALPILILFICEVVSVKEGGVEWVIEFADFIMKVAAGGSACIAYITNELAAFDLLSGSNYGSTQMSVQSGIAVAVIDYDVIPITPGFGFDQGHCSVGGGVNFGAYGGSKVHPGVERRCVVEGVSSIAKSAGELT